MNSQLSKEQLDLIDMLKLLEETFAGNDTKKIDEAKNKLQQKFQNIKYAISLLFQALSIDSIENRKIPENLHKSVAIYLKNIFLRNNESFGEADLISYLQKIIELVLTPNKVNPNIHNPTIFNVIQTIITYLSSSKLLLKNENKNYIIQLFDVLLKSIKSVSSEDFLIIGKTIILICSALLSSKSADKDNYEEIIRNYYIPIINIIFANVPNYIDPKNNIYNNEFISLLKYLFDGFYSNLSKMRGVLDVEKRKDISIKFFREYGLYSYELIQLTPSFDKATADKFGKPNPIIVFNVDEKKCYDINHMKSKVIQFLSFITQISTIETKKAEDDSKNVINDQELVDLINKVIYLIINSFRDILNNKEKFYFIRRYNEEFNEEEDSFNILLFQICVFLTRSLIREPIKSEFTNNMKQFLLNILFPMVVTIEDEKDFLDMEPEGYHLYINDISSEFKNKNFRTAACFLINKISEKYEDMFYFISSFSIEMLNFIINEGKIQTGVSQEFNVYIKNIKEALINQFNEVIKLDFSLLIILILKEKIKKNPIFKNSLREIFINNQDKIHSIDNPIIKIKLCKIYNYYLPKFFKKGNDINENIKKKCIENAINFLLNNIIQKNRPNGDDEYLQALSYEASDAITELLSLSKSDENKERQLLYLYINQNLDKNFALIIKLIENVDIYSFFLVIDQILSNVQISQRNLLFECINNLTKKFLGQFLKQNPENKLFSSQYFNCLNSFLTGKNKINPDNKEEIKKFNEIFDPVLSYIKNPKKFNLYEELVSLTEDYIKAFNGINERSSLVLKSLKLILDYEKTTSSISYSFTSTFLSYIQKNISDEPLDQAELFKEILIIIKKSFEFIEESNKTSKLYALLLTLQILNLNPNLPEEIFSFLIFHSMNSFEIIEINDEFYNDRNNVNQLSLANVSLGFIFKPDLTFKILQRQIILNENRKIIYFDKFYQLLLLILNLSYPDYNPLLGKCMILGICGILSNKTCLDYLNAHKDNKIFLLKIFIKFIFLHKKEKTTILNRLMKRELKCNFVEEENEEEEEEEEEEDDEIDQEFNEKVENILGGDNSINNSDEFKYYTEIMKYIKETDNDIYNFIVKENPNGNSNIIEELFKVRNIKIKYNDKELTVPRKTVKIVRKFK
jgi:hypothetical protein